jgi:GNAT superfamily N-acetyltransferase
VSISFRPFREEDYPRYVEIHNRVYPDYAESLEEVRHHDAAWDSRRYERLRLVAEDAAGAMVAYSQINHMPSQFHPRKFSLDLLVDPARRRRGTGSALYGRMLEELAARDALLARTEAQESMTASIDFLAHRGFTEVQREWESRLDVATFDAGSFSGAEGRTAHAGIAITTLAAERERDPDLLSRVYALHAACERDVPAVDPVTDIPFELFLAHTIDTPGALADAHFLARDGERYVGLSNLFRSLEDPDVLWQGLTGVLREYRGRGIAMALKLATVRYARAHGYPEIRTWNDTRNRPMLRINEAMGFQKQPAWIVFEKRLGAE